MFNPSRDEARRFFVESWAKFRAGIHLSDLETIAAGLIAAHPEYHAVLDDSERNLDRDFPPEAGAVNPFLHLSLHLAVAEQIAVDQPPGVRAHFERLRAARGDEHAALHALTECIGEMIWQAQRNRTAPDASIYFACLERKS
jgi:hypothetical protein